MALVMLGKQQARVSVEPAPAQPRDLPSQPVLL
jgi:hypothetical protein